MAETSLPPLNWLRAFEAAARNLSFTGAARELHMTQSAISQQIKSLENFLGKPLLLRRTRALELTDAAENYLPTVQEAFATLATGTRAVVGYDRGRVLEVRSNLAFSIYWLAPRLERLLDRHPWLSLNITTALWADDRAASDADVEIRFGRDAGQGARRLTNDTFFPVCAPGYDVDETSFQDRPWFDCAGLLSNWETWLKAQGRTFPSGKTVNLATTFAVSLSAARGGAGLALAHETLAAGLLEAGELQRPFNFAAPMEETYFLLSPPQRRAKPASAAFVDWIEEELSASGAIPSG